MTPCSLIFYRHFGEMYCLHLQDRRTSRTRQETERRHNQEDIILHCHHWEPQILQPHRLRGGHSMERPQVPRKKSILVKTSIEIVKLRFCAGQYLWNFDSISYNVDHFPTEYYSCLFNCEQCSWHTQQNNATVSSYFHTTDFTGRQNREFFLAYSKIGWYCKFFSVEFENGLKIFLSPANQ